MLLLDKSGNALAAKPISFADTANFTPAGDFTLEIFKVKWSALANQVLFSHWLTTGNQRSQILQYNGTALQFAGSLNGSTNTTISYTWTPTTGVEYDLCVDRSGSTVRLYTDGVMRASGTISGGLFNSTDLLWIGSGSGGITPATATAKAFRYTNGTARYATGSSYTVPTLPLPTT